MTTATRPADYGLPHSEWRPDQYETIQWAMKQERAILEAPTGIGKTSIVRALSTQRSVLSLVVTKFLQDDNYLPLGFKVLKGKSNYKCIHADARPDTTVQDCLFNEEGMSKCPVYNQCQYVVAREVAKISNRASLNYSYWFHAHDTWPEVGVIACDEAHRLPGIVTEWAGIDIDNEERKKWELPQFPPILQSNLLLSGESSAEYLAVEWLAAARLKLLTVLTKLEQKPPTVENRRKRDQCEQLGKKIRATIDAMTSSDKNWYVRSGPAADGRGFSFVAKPLTARYHFGNWFLKQHGDGTDTGLFLMSATIGNVNVFAEELGLTDYTFHATPSPWPAAVRPIYELDVPRMGKSSKPADWDRQADEIAKAIKALDPNWSGLVLVTSKVQAADLTRRLGLRGLERRVICAPQTSTEKVVEFWHHTLRSRPGAILVAWQLWEGYNGTKEEFLVIAKTPWWNMGDEFEVRRASFNNKFARWQAAQTLMQGLGRIWRGNESDYKVNGHVGKYVAIADMGWRYLGEDYLSQEIRSAIKKK